MNSSQKIELKKKEKKDTARRPTHDDITTPSLSFLTFSLPVSVLCGPLRRPPVAPLSLVLGDHHHHADPEQQRQDLHEGLAEAGAAHQQLGQHRHRGDVDEAAGGEGQDPGGGGRAHALRQQRAGGAGQSAQRRQQLQEDGLRGTSGAAPSLVSAG